MMSHQDVFGTLCICLMSALSEAIPSLSATSGSAVFSPDGSSFPDHVQTCNLEGWSSVHDEHANDDKHVHSLQLLNLGDIIYKLICFLQNEGLSISVNHPSFL